ncbi:MAG: N-acetyltransferase [Calditrichaeota bacterium]|nr:MAG: N-acetyltransferase [Calditrichota bacterium]
MIELQPFTREDIPRLIGWINSPELLIQWTGYQFRYPLTADQLEQHLRRSETSPPECYIFKARERESGEVIGHIELDRIDRVNRKAWLCRVLVGPPEKRDRGYGTAMVRQILEFAFGKLGLHRVYLHVLIFNLPAITCYKNVGFQIETTLPNDCKIGEKYWSTHRMVIEAQQFHPST